VSEPQHGCGDRQQQQSSAGRDSDAAGREAPGTPPLVVVVVFIASLFIAHQYRQYSVNNTCQSYATCQTINTRNVFKIVHIYI